MIESHNAINRLDDILNSPRVRPIRPIASDPAGNQKIGRAKAKEKVDGAVALAMAIGVAAGSGRQASVYEERPSFLTI
jgi:hypothetical protein